MTYAAFDTHKAVKTLTAAGVEEAQAEVLVDTFGGALTGTLATKEDLERAGEKLSGEIAQVRGEIAGTEEKLRVEIAHTEERLTAKIETQGVELRGEIATTEERLSAKIEGVRTEIAGQDAKIEGVRTLIAVGQAQQLRWMIGGMIALAGMVAAATAGVFG